MVSPWPFERALLKVPKHEDQKERLKILNNVDNAKPCKTIDSAYSKCR